jgi:hypothetical protein
MSGPAPGGRPRLTELEHGVILGLIATGLSGGLVRQPHREIEDEGARGPTRRTPDALAEAAHAQGIVIKRSQVHRTLRSAGACWREALSWTVSRAPAFGPKGAGQHSLLRPTGRGDDLCIDELGPLITPIPTRRPRARLATGTTQPKRRTSANQRQERCEPPSSPRDCDRCAVTRCAYCRSLSDRRT